MNEETDRFVMIENPGWDVQDYADWLSAIGELELRLDKAMDDVDPCGVDPQVRDVLSILRSRITADAIQLLGVVVGSASTARIDANSNLAKAVVLLWAAGLLSCRRNTFILEPAEDVQMDDDFIRIAVLDILEAEDGSLEILLPTWSQAEIRRAGLAGGLDNGGEQGAFEGIHHLPNVGAGTTQEATRSFTDAPFESQPF